MRSRAVDEMGERRRRLAETHVVGETATETEAVEEPQPAEAATLVRAQLTGERGRLDLLAQRGVGQSAEQQPGPRRRDDPAVDGVEVGVGESEVVAGGGRLGGQLQQRQRAPATVAAGRFELLDLAEVGIVASAGLAQGGRVDADPAVADVQQ